MTKKNGDLTVAERRFLVRVAQAGGVYHDRSFDPARWYMLNGRMLRGRMAPTMIAAGYLVATADALFPGDSQSYVPVA